jgi:shikimate dehydrogenase
MKKACVIGWPIKHSRSPIIHNYWLKQLDIDGLYERVAVEPKNLHDFIRNLDPNGYKGCNVTIPHKEAVVSAVDDYDTTVAQTGSLNTVYINNNKILGTSTDGDGFLNNILAHYPDFQIQDKTVFMIGAGGSAKAICQKLISSNVRTICVLNRTVERALELQKQFGEKIQIVQTADTEERLKISDLLVNTTSQGMSGQPQLDLNVDCLPNHAIVADIVYVPLKTKLIERAEARKLKTVPGLGMLLHQAVEGFEKWFGVRPVVTQELYDLVEADILSEQPR